MRLLSRSMAASIGVAIALLFALTTVGVASVGQPDEASCVGNDEKSCSASEKEIKADEPPTEPIRPSRRNAPVSATFHNRSPYRADIHHDDGRFGRVVGTAEANGGSVRLSTFPDHRFFVTMHGVRNGLVDPASDEQYFFAVGDPEEQVFVLPETAAPSTTKCKDRYPVCVGEARRGECARNPGWMIVNCCKSCDDVEGYGHLIDSEVRCDPERLNSTIPAWKPGSLDQLFTGWATEDEYKRYEPRAVSSPNKVHGAERDGPWIMTFDSFFDDFEIEQLLKGAEYGGFERSTDQGKVVGGSGEMQKVTSSTRTSSNAWCRAECESLPDVQKVTQRIEEVTGIPSNNYESFQILEYQEGQFYRQHHDSSNINRKKAAGHRILTFFLYLSDVEEGGETRFTKLDVSIEPKKGRALVWPSVLNDDPDSTDGRMYHEAKEVIKGTKYAANHWIHQYDFRNANLWGCNGSFA